MYYGDKDVIFILSGTCVVNTYYISSGRGPYGKYIIHIIPISIYIQGSNTFSYLEKKILKNEEVADEQ